MKKRLFFSFKFFVKIALATILPLAVFAVAGILLDKRLESSPSLSVIGILISVIITVLLIKIITRDIAYKLQVMDK